MKALKHIAGVIALSAALTACSDHKKETDTQDSTVKTDTPAKNSTTPIDTAKTDSNKLNKDNADASGRTAVDTSDARPVH